MILLYILLALVIYEVVSVVALFILWVVFAAAMGMKRSRDEGRLHPTIIKCGELVEVLGLPYDSFCNIFFTLGVLFDVPREATVSDHLKRLVRGDPTKRKTKIATWFAVNALNSLCAPDDPHISIPERVAP